MSKLVETVGLSKQYASGGAVVRAVSEIAVSVHQGEFVAIVGRSGSGKTTLMNLLGLLERPDAGSYTLAGRDVAQLDEDARALLRGREIGFVFQLPTLLARATALENVALPLVYAGTRRTERYRRAREALESVSLGHRAHHMPNQLSGGEQQRVVIARAVVNDPSLILADEPTGALDSRTSDEILSLFVELNRVGRTILIVTHGPEVAQRAQRCITLHDGRIIGDDKLGQATTS